MNRIAALWTLLLSPDGRIKRRAFWAGAVLLVAVDIAFTRIPWRVIKEPVALLTAYPWICINAKRLHDLGRSGRLQIIPWLTTAPITLIDLWVAGIELVYGADMGEAAHAARLDNPLFSWVLWTAMVVNLAFSLWIGFARSKPGPNRFGPEPGVEPIEDVFS